ncbi:MAG: cobalamin biosynthesis protein CbiM [Deltaproteobacteria bacterium SG8_13]|nr:MAG: cobalamin biosynthesis protein CbiM [Deltaproteobacteria bacterium SG8_13]
MHISEGVLSGPVLISGAVLAAAGTAVGLKKIDYDRIARVGILSASFFVASLIHVPIGPASIHLIMNGLVGLLLGWAAFPAILVALLMQGVFFQYGGITTLGVNTMIMALPAVICYHLFAPLLAKGRKAVLAAAFGCGFCAVLLGAVIVGLALMFTEEKFLEVATLVVTAHLPVMIIEGLITAFTVVFLQKVQPSMLPTFDGSPQKTANSQK